MLLSEIEDARHQGLEIKLQRISESLYTADKARLTVHPGRTSFTDEVFDRFFEKETV